MLEWNIGRGYRRATGVAGVYVVSKGYGEAKYTLHYAQFGTHHGDLVGFKYSSYAQAERAADDHNHAIIDKWRRPVATPAAVQEAAALALEWNGYVAEEGQPLLRAARTLADYINGLERSNA
jgi:hypothetical protein